MAREVTQEQFADGTTIDGDRIDRAMQETVDRFNRVRRGDLQNRFFPQTYVVRWMPRINGSTGTNFPFMAAENPDLATGADTPERTENELRVKGFRAPGIEVLDGTGSNHWISSTPLAFPKPVILDDISFMLTVDHNSLGSRVFTNGFTYGATPPDGYVTADGSEDFSLVVSVDNPFYPEDQRLASKVFAYHGVSLLRETYWVEDPGTPPSSDTSLSWPGGTVEGVYFRAKDLAIPIPAGARVRVHMVVPEYATASDSDWGAGTANDPTTMQMYDLNWVTLEEVC